MEKKLLFLFLTFTLHLDVDEGHLVKMHFLVFQDNSETTKMYFHVLSVQQVAFHAG